MSIVKLNNRSVKDITAFGSISSLGSLTHIATQTASSSASVSFTSGIDSTYKEYIFYFVNLHPSSGQKFQFQGDTGTNTNYNQTITSTSFNAYHDEGDSYTALEYRTDADQAQGTSFNDLTNYMVATESDSSLTGFLHIFNPSSTTFVKHFISRTQIMNGTSSFYSIQNFHAGYFNTTSAIDEIQFKMSSGNIDSGTIKLYGVS